MNELEQKIRSIIHLSKPVLEDYKQILENLHEKDDLLYVKTVQSLILIDEIKKELEKKDPRSSKKFTQKKLF